MHGFYLIILLVYSQVVCAFSIEKLAYSNPMLVEQVNLSELKPNQLYISTPFAQHIILNPEQKRILKEKAIVKIELVYTQFRTSSTFNQKQLNLKRLKQLQKLAPFVFDFPLWDFKLIEQTFGNSREECNKMFHGFIFTFRPPSTNNTLQKEANYIDKLVTTMLKNDSIFNDTTKKKYDIKTSFDKKWGFMYDTIYYIDTIPPPKPPDFFYNHSLYKDSTVLNVFKRNTDWYDFIVVTDVTGSMSPYIAQVFVWLKAQSQSNNAKYFVFFNDGDNSVSSKKKPLETKGVYVTKNNGINKITQVATKCMRNGSGGGESMENDVEAIIDGLKQYPKASSVILIADNFESMRDYDFIKKIKTPVHVILCGAENMVNIQYLDLAYLTHGSIHTKFSDVSDLSKIKDGEYITIDEQRYLFKNKQFHFVYESFNYQNKSARKATIKISSK